MYRRLMVSAGVVALLAGLLGVAYAASDWLTGTTDEKLNTLAAIQPGLGTVMREYADRYGIMYYAAKAGNWDMAAYQLKEALEIQEVAETTRPKRKSGLQRFEQTYLQPIDAAIKAKNWSEFEAAWNAGVEGCNRCHKATGYGYIVYQLPPAPPGHLKLEL